MRITTPYGTLLVDEQTRIPLTITNPMFSNEGSHSLPFTVPWCEHNLAALGHPERVHSAKKDEIHIEPVLISASNFEEVGRIEILPIENNSRIEVYFLTKEGLFWSWCKETRLRDLTFPDPNAHPSPNSPYPSSLTCVFPVAIEEESDVFAFPSGIYYTNWGVPENFNKADKRILSAFNVALSLYDLNSEGSFEFPRYRPYPEDPDNPNNVIFKYNYTEFLYVNTIIDIIIKGSGLYLEQNDLTTIPELNRLCILNNACNAFDNNTIDYKLLVPDITVLDFIVALENKFNCCLFTDFRKKSCSILFRDQLLVAKSEKNIEGKVVKLSKEYFDISITHDEFNDEFIAETPISLDELVNDYNFQLYYPNYGMDPSSLEEITSYTNDGSFLEKIYLFKGSQYAYLYKLFNNETFENEGEDNNQFAYKIQYSKFGALSSQLEKSDKTFNFHSKSVLHSIFTVRVPSAFYWETDGFSTSERYFSKSLQFMPYFPVKANDKKTAYSINSTKEEVQEFPLCFSIFRGKLEPLWDEMNPPAPIGGGDEFVINYAARQPFGSCFPYDRKNSLLSKSSEPEIFPDDLSLQTFGYGSISETFFKNTREFFKQAAVPVEIFNFNPAEVLKLNVSSIYCTENINYIITEIQIEIGFNGTSVVSVSGLTAKPLLDS